MSDPDSGIARIFMHGRSQAVRLPLAFRLAGDRVRVRVVRVDLDTSRIDFVLAGPGR